MLLYQNNIKVFVPPPNTKTGILMINGKGFVGTEHPNGFKFVFDISRIQRPNITYPFIRWGLENGEQIDEPIGEFNLLKPEKPFPEWSVENNVFVVYSEDFDFDANGELETTKFYDKTMYVNKTLKPITIKFANEIIELPPSEQRFFDDTKGVFYLSTWGTEQLDIIYACEQMNIETAAIKEILIYANGNELISLPQGHPLNLTLYKVQCNVEIDVEVLSAASTTFAEAVRVAENSTAVFTNCEVLHPNSAMLGTITSTMTLYNPSMLFEPKSINGVPKGLTDFYEQMRGWVIS
jgi:hypothetical protein